MSHRELVERCLNAYFHSDPETVLASVTDDFEWVNVALPMATIRGRTALEAKLAVPDLGLPLPLEAADHDTTLVLEDGDRLMHERVDRLTFSARTLIIPCAAAWEIRSGRIAVWRDYYDIGVVLRFFAGIGRPLDTSRWW